MSATGQVTRFQGEYLGLMFGRETSTIYLLAEKRSFNSESP